MTQLDEELGDISSKISDREFAILDEVRLKVLTFGKPACVGTRARVWTHENSFFLLDSLEFLGVPFGWWFPFYEHEHKGEDVYFYASTGGRCGGGRAHRSV